MSRPISLSSCGPRQPTWKVVLAVLILLNTVSAGRASVRPTVSTRQEPSITVLEPGKPLERQISGGETHIYQLTLSANQYVKVAVDQRRINIGITAYTSDGKKLSQADMFPIGDSELMSFVVDTPTTYRLEIKAPDTTTVKGTYEIKIKDSHVATDVDKSAVAGERLTAEGITIHNTGTPDALRKAIDLYQQSLPLWQAAKEPAWEASSLYMMAHAYLSLRDMQKGFEFSNRSWQVAQTPIDDTDNDKRLLAIKVKVMALNTMGRAELEFGDRKKAIARFSEALSLARSMNDHAREVDTLNYLAVSHEATGNYPESLSYLGQERKALSELGDRAKEATLINNMCVIQTDLGDYRRAVDLCNEAISIRRELNDRGSEAILLSNLGNAYSNMGEYQKSLDAYTQAYEIHKSGNVLQGQGITLNNIAFLYASLGDHEKAITIYNQALEIFVDQKDRYRQANILSNLGVNYAATKDFKKALEIHLRVLPIRQELHDREGQGVSLNNIAGCYSNLGEKEKALDHFNQSVALLKTAAPRHLINALMNQGALYRDMKQFDKALLNFNEALRLSRSTGNLSAEAALLSHMARLETDRGNLVEARSLIETALTKIESLRVNIKNQQLRRSFFASVRLYHELDIGVLMRLHQLHPTEGFDVAAFQVSERSRARSLLEMVVEAGAEIRQGVKSELVERERTLRQSIANQAERQTRMMSASQEQISAADKEIDSLTTEYEQVQAQIRQTSPRYAALTQPAPLKLTQIQEELLDQNTILLEYTLGENASFVFAVTPTSIKSFELPKRAEVETAARNFYDQINSPKQAEVGDRATGQVDAKYKSAAATLSRMLLGPLASELRNKRLLIVGEGILQYVPFAALPEPRSFKDNAQAEVQDDQAPLIVNHEIITLPSASVLGVLRQEAVNRQRPSKTVAVFADPVFDSKDSRIADAAPRPAPESTSLGRSVMRQSASESGLSDFARLRFSRSEAEEIVRLTKGSKSLEAVDFAANRATAIAPEIGDYRILHFATHGLINNQHAELSGVVLSLVNEKGEPQNGFLRVYDIYNLNLRAELVVLSACQTALGRDIKGEGLVGMTRAFMYAGATRVVASLWRTEDRSTAALMSRFYNGMLTRRLTPAAALRSAQVSMWQDKRWRDPRYWAAFTLQGEWK